VAEANKRNGFMCCPCGVCRNEKDYPSTKTLHIHLFQFGFMSGYNCWTKHRERGVMMEDNDEKENDDNYPEFPETTDTAIEDNEEEDDEERTSDMPADDLGQVIVDAQIDCESESEKDMCVIKQVVYTCIYMLVRQDILYIYRRVYYVVLYEYVYTKTCLK
jgi:hypothetical protein